ncbi:unnamed protein product [Thelazia callipaeda]|uniref:PDZ domain-containing protein n=1 Tax=Thelazia callipaeda TaxID=103827 RepID=A0A0N5CX10_THECL|nr:unnamed protein product [Thelazia callipaeda]
MSLTSTSGIVDTSTESSVEIYVKSNMAIGVVLSRGPLPKVVQLLPFSSLLGKLFVNDVIISVDGKPVYNTSMLIEVIRAAEGRKILIKYRRTEKCSSNIRILPKPRQGWDSFEIEMSWSETGMPTGILVHEDSWGHIVVSMVQNGTATSKSLKPGDVLTKINDKPVKDKDTAKQVSSYIILL